MLRKKSLTLRMRSKWRHGSCREGNDVFLFRRRDPCRALDEHRAAVPKKIGLPREAVTAIGANPEHQAFFRRIRITLRPRCQPEGQLTTISDSLTLRLSA